MLIPGANVLNLAMQILTKQSFQYVAYLGRDSNNIGIYQDDYDEAIPIRGMIQAVQRSLYDQMGLDFQKNYHMFYVPNLIGDVHTAQAGDQFIYDNRTWSCLSTIPWFAMDGWTECTCVEVLDSDTPEEYHATLSTPGSNTLNLAMQILTKQSFQYVAYLGRDSNNIGIYQDDYDDPIPATGSVQPVQRSLYDQMGLDFQKNYHTFYVPERIGDVARVRAGDKFIYNTQTWQCLSTIPWFAIDGWTEGTCVEITGTNPDDYYTDEQGLPFTTEDGLQFYVPE